MAQRKKKPSGHQLEIIAHAQYKNEFMRKLKLIVNICCGEDIYSLIPHRILEKVYLLRYHPVQITVAEGHIIPLKFMTELKVVFAELLKIHKVGFSPMGYEISLHDLVTVGFSINYIVSILEAEDIPNTNKITSALNKYCLDIETQKNATMQFLKILLSIGFGMSNIENRFYWFDYTLKDHNDSKHGIDNHLRIYTEVPKTICVKIDGVSRPALRLGWANFLQGMTWFTLRPSLLNISGVPGDQPMEVYIQSHALHRFRERTDGIYDFVAQEYIYHSFINPKVCFDRNHNLLIEYRIMDSKAGYFRFDVVRNIIVVKTFLFLTNSGTPEGDLLAKNTGLKVLDMKYLTIDKLSTFMSSDIANNVQIIKIFTDAGCQSLFELYAKVADICTKHSNQTPFARMLDYLRINEASIKETVTAE